MKSEIRNEIRRQYNTLVDERNAIETLKSSSKSNVGRYCFQSGVVTPSEKMLKATINRNAIRNLLIAYRQHLRGLRLEVDGPDAGCSEWTPPVKTWRQLRREYLKIMDDDAKIAQDWKLRRVDWKKCKDQFAENEKKRGVIIDEMDKLNKEKGCE